LGGEGYPRATGQRPKARSQQLEASSFFTGHRNQAEKNLNGPQPPGWKCLGRVVVGYSRSLVAFGFPQKFALSMSISAISVISGKVLTLVLLLVDKGYPRAKGQEPKAKSQRPKARSQQLEASSFFTLNNPH
jgi:hypothetical protein